MSRAPLLLAALVLAGCGETARQWNPLATPAVTVSSPALVARDARLRGAPCPAGAYVQAWCDKEAREIRLPDSGPRNLLVAFALHKFGHEIEDEYPDVWRHLNAMASPTFPCGQDGMRDGGPEARAAAAALRESARRQAQESQK